MSGQSFFEHPSSVPFRHQDEGVLTGNPFGFKNQGSDTVTGWGVKLPQGVGASGDTVRIVSRSGAVRRKTLSRIITSWSDVEGTWNAWSLRVEEEDG